MPWCCTRITPVHQYITLGCTALLINKCDILPSKATKPHTSHVTIILSVTYQSQHKGYTSFTYPSISTSLPEMPLSSHPGHSGTTRFPKRRSVSLQHSPRHQHDAWNDYSAPDSVQAEKHWESTLQSLDEANLVC